MTYQGKQHDKSCASMMSSTNSRTSSIIHHDNNHNIDTEPGVCIISAEDGERIRQSYEDNVGIRMTLVVARMIEQAVKDGLTVEEVILAIEETGFAPSPSPHYLRAILRHWTETGLTISKAQHWNRPNGSRVTWWQTRNGAMRSANAWKGEEED